MIVSAGTLTMPGVGVALAPFIWRVFALPGKRMDRLGDRVGDFAGRPARLEGAADLLTGLPVDREGGRASPA